MLHLRHRLKLAATALREGGVIAYPTEAVWGLGCDPLDPVAVQQLLNIKQRPDYKGLILVASCWEQLLPYLDQTSLNAHLEHVAKAKSQWPGPITWVMPSLAPAWLTGGRDTIAVRVTDHPLVAALCDEFGGAIVSTSANISGCPAATSMLTLHRAIDCTALTYCLNGDTGGLNKPTAIHDLLSGQCLRA